MAELELLPPVREPVYQRPYVPPLYLERAPLPAPPVYFVDRMPTCPVLPEHLESQADVDAWNAAYPACPLPAYAELCELDARPSEREAVIAWNQSHPQCTPIPVIEEPTPPRGSSRGALLVGLAVLAAGVLVFAPRRR